MRSGEHEKYCRSRGSGRWFGLFVVLLGVGLLFKKLDLDIFPDWLFSWPVVIIAAGLILGIRHRFSHPFPYILILLGSFFLFKRLYGLPIDFEPYTWPVILIILGLMILFKPRHHRKHEKFREFMNHRHESDKSYYDPAGSPDMMESIAVFCGNKKNILSKSFKGGEAIVVFGGSEINLSQADLSENAVLEVTVVFGGMKIIVPSNWEVNINVMNVAAGIEDKRNLAEIAPQEGKVLTITGNMVFGGLDIHNHS